MQCNYWDPANISSNLDVGNNTSTSVGMYHFCTVYISGIALNGGYCLWKKKSENYLIFVGE